ncbi:MAG: NAD(P)/FAD-dependent oxidoreductase [Pikeienuella sp.]
MKPNRLPVDPGPAGWNAILPPAPDATPLKGEAKADWLIIGAGPTGLAAARQLNLLQPDAGIAVLDAVRIAEGPAGRNSGFMIDLPHDLASDNYGGAIAADRKQTQANRAAIAFNLKAAKDYAMPEEAIRHSGKVNAAATDKGLSHNADYASHLANMGEDHRLLNAAEMKAITGGDYYKGGLFTPGTALLQPAQFYRGMAAGLGRSGVAVHECSPVINLTRTDGGWLAETPNGSVRSTGVIMAVNGHAESFGLFQRRLMHVFTYASLTRALTAEEVARLGGEPNWGFTPADPLGTTVRRISGVGGDRIVIRNRFTYDPTMEVGPARLCSVGRSHRRAFEARFPMLSGVEMEYCWGGRLCLSRNNVPAFGEVEPGLIVASCQNGLGTAKGALSGMMAATLATRQDSDLLHDHMAQAAPVRLPPEPFSWLGANAVMKWGEVKAGAEM